MLYGEARVWLKMRLNGIKRGIKVKSVAYLVIYEYALLNVMSTSVQLPRTSFLFLSCKAKP
jgi:hypothetical protein